MSATRLIVTFACKSAQMEQFIDNKKNIILVGHLNPDGDCIGSLTAMYYYLRQRGIKATMIVPNHFPITLKFLEPRESAIKIFSCCRDFCIEAVSNADLIICLDLNAFNRTEGIAPYLSESKADKILIDHHPMPDVNAFQLVISRTDVSSACEILYYTLLEMSDIAGDTSRLCDKCATSLFTGMLTDTNNFCNSLFPGTFRMASALLSSGVDRNMIYNNVFCSYSTDRMRLLGKMLHEKMKIMPEYGVGYLTLSGEDKSQFNYHDGDSEGFVNMPLSIAGVVFSALFTENEDCVRVSLRSKGDIDVNNFSRRYCNGGGHVNASGGRLYIPFPEVPDYSEKCIAEFFSGKGN